MAQKPDLVMNYFLTKAPFGKHLTEKSQLESKQHLSFNSIVNLCFLSKLFPQEADKSFESEL